MILYFSATGNCKYVAARLAEADGQEVLSIADCMREKRFSFEDETIGVISPTYDWGAAEHRQGVSGAGGVPDKLSVFCCDLRHNARRDRRDGKGSDQGPRHRCLLCRSDAGYLDADF